MGCNTYCQDYFHYSIANYFSRKLALTFATFPESQIKSLLAKFALKFVKGGYMVY